MRNKKTFLTQTLLATIALAIPTFFGSAHAALLYEFNFGVLNIEPIPFTYGINSTYGATSITFESPNFATFEDVLTYVSGSVNGCRPSVIKAEFLDKAFTSNFFLAGNSCEKREAPEIYGFLFYLDDYRNGTLPTTLGTFRTSAAGRELYRPYYGINFFYTDGYLAIREDDRYVPEPASIALLGLGFLGFAASRCKSVK